MEKCRGTWFAQGLSKRRPRSALPRDEVLIFNVSLKIFSITGLLILSVALLYLCFQDKPDYTFFCLLCISIVLEILVLVFSTIPCMCKNQLEDELLLNHEPGLLTYTQEVFQPVNNYTFSLNETEVHYVDYETSKYMQACQKPAIIYP
ncbi:hypothetical protein X975_17577, partial [Stegodyphus mimosarum]